MLKAHLMQKRYEYLKGKYPDETEERLRTASEGVPGKPSVPLGKSRERPGRGEISR